jgi:hypothetical protein
MLRRTVLPALGVIALALPLTGASAAPTATASKGCGYSRSLGFTYVNKITAKGTTCGKAKKLIKAYHGAGAGDRTVNGYKCSDKVVAESPVQYDATASCKKGTKKVSFIYTQNT